MLCFLTGTGDKHAGVSSDVLQLQKSSSTSPRPFPRSALYFQDFGEGKQHTGPAAFPGRAPTGLTRRSVPGDETS